MWDGVTPVDQHHDPLIFEGTEPETVVINNTGPGTIKVLAWRENRPSLEEVPPIRFEVRPGNVKAVKGSLVRVSLFRSIANLPSDHHFAAIGWYVKR